MGTSPTPMAADIPKTVLASGAGLEKAPAAAPHTPEATVKVSPRARAHVIVAFIRLAVCDQIDCCCQISPTSANSCIAAASHGTMSRRTASYS